MLQYLPSIRNCIKPYDMAIKETLQAEVLMKYRSTQKHKLDLKRRFSIIIFNSIC